MSDPTIIEICSSVHTYERRHCWMLSSILQQKGIDLGRVRICSAYIKDHPNTKPSTGEVLNHFEEISRLGRVVTPVVGIVKDQARFHHVPYEDEKGFMKRGEVRNRHVDEANATWIAFMDADMVLPPDYLATLMEILERPGFREYDGCLYAGRHSTILEPTEDLVDSDPDRYPCVIPKAWEQASKLPSIRKSNIGAGYLHVCRTAWMKERGYYVPPGKAADWDWNRRHSKCKSDAQFRREVGKKKLPIHRLIHLQHKRDSDFGSHVELQR